ncbi:MAG: hypothetical protein M1815_003580 [Lichina confinis]|nr:MAG: hypothetical protein M1815_003580 [Lichina confinis]
MHLPHGPVELPVFMPVATQGSLKGLTPEQLESTGCRLCLNNTYHLGHRPGPATLELVGGAHKFQSWAHNLLTDSGGFQMVSLSKLAEVTEEGVSFLSPHDNSPMLLTPEYSTRLQNVIGSDIVMQLDDVIAATSPDAARMEQAMRRSIRWLDRCIKAHQHPDRQSLFCIIQGGLDLNMRRTCCEEMLKRDTPGIAIGGLSGGEAKDMVDICTDMFPDNKPRYVMGVGYPEDLIVSVALGADMFDCVWPTRTARFGNAVTASGNLNLRNAVFSEDFSPIEPGCTCRCCRTVDDGGLGVTRAFIHHLAAKETAGAHLTAILEDQFPRFIRTFFEGVYGGDPQRFPPWAVTALKKVNIDLDASWIGG